MTTVDSPKTKHKRVKHSNKSNNNNDIRKNKTKNNSRSNNNHSSNENNNNQSMPHKGGGDTPAKKKIKEPQEPKHLQNLQNPLAANFNISHQPKNHKRQISNQTTDSVLSSDSDIRFTRRKLGDNQKCGCAVIAGFLVTLLFSGAVIFIGYTYLRPEPLANRIFRSRFHVLEGDSWSSELADQSTLRFQHRSRDYRERINLVIRRSDLRDGYEGSEILALDGNDGEDITVHFVLHFDPYANLVSTADLHSILLEEITAPEPRYFANLTIDPQSLEIREDKIGEMDDLLATSSSPLGRGVHVPSTILPSPRHCEPLKLKYCQSIGYNTTTYPNLLGHQSYEEVEADLIAFRELVDSECFRQAFDFLCRLLQPPCIHASIQPIPGAVCREYCQSFATGCSERLPKRFKEFLDCEKFPESTSIQSCHNQPGCSLELQTNALSSRLCDGIADCPDLSDEMRCAFCPYGSLYCGRGRFCVAHSSRCDGKFDCPDGSDEKDCLSIAPHVSYLTNPTSLIPHRPMFYDDGFAVFSEKGKTGKLCSEGMENNLFVRNTVAESLCKALGYEKVLFTKIRNDTEPDNNYVRVLDPRASEISFVRTLCLKRQALYLRCADLQCGIQSAVSNQKGEINLSKMATPGDWPWHVSLFRSETHVCDGTLISSEWVLTTESCFQGQPKATWLAVFGSVRLNANAPWTQRRRIIGMVKSPVEGSTAALVRLEKSVSFTDFVRPICLPDEGSKQRNTAPTKKSSFHGNTDQYHPQAEKYSQAPVSGKRVKRKPLKENRQYFDFPSEEQDDYFLGSEKLNREYPLELVDDNNEFPKAEAVSITQPYPIGIGMDKNLPQITNVPKGLPPSYTTASTKPMEFHHWMNCNTLGWNRQREHLQRVQLKISDMKACENISIATVNSMCTEAAFHKQDCSEEEFAGSPVMCQLPKTKHWTLVGIASWRIACAPTGIERPRMYDKLTSNSAWIRDTIASSTI